MTNANPSPELIDEITREIWDAAPIRTHAEARELADTLAALSQALPAPGEVERLRAALKPFADACNFTTADDSESLYDTLAAEKLTWRDLRNARTTLGEKPC